MPRQPTTKMLCQPLLCGRIFARVSNIVELRVANRSKIVTIFVWTASEGGEGGVDTRWSCSRSHVLFAQLTYRIPV
jgi:hypothetical protein